MGKPPFYTSHNNKRAAARRRRHRWLLKHIRGLSQISPAALWVEHTTANPDDAVSRETIRRDLRAIQDSEVRCPWCRRSVTVEELVGEDA